MKRPSNRWGSAHPVAALSLDQLEAALLAVDTGAPEADQRAFAKMHARRIHEMLLRVPPAEEGWRLLDVGCHGQWIGPYVDVLGYRDITAIAHQEEWGVRRDMARRKAGPPFTLAVDILDAEVEPFPYADESFDVIVFCSMLEHLALDPMHVMCEINRVLRPGGSLTISTPNIASLPGLLRVLAGRSPYFEGVYFATDVHRHNREYTTAELVALVENSGFAIASAETIAKVPFGLRWVLGTALALPAALAGWCPLRWRGKHSIVRAVKTGSVQERWPAWLYSNPWLAASWYRRYGGEIGARRLNEWTGPR